MWDATPPNEILMPAIALLDDLLSLLGHYVQHLWAISDWRQSCQGQQSWSTQAEDDGVCQIHVLHLVLTE
jgi:hypothetical protein